MARPPLVLTRRISATRLIPAWTVTLVSQPFCNAMAIETSSIPVELTMCTDGSNRHGHGTTGSGLTGSHNTGAGLTGRNDNTGYGSHGTGSGLTGRNDNTGYGSHGTGSGLTGRNDNTGYGADSTTAGPHSSNLANKADPRVDSDLGQSILLDAGSTRLV